MKEKYSLTSRITKEEKIEHNYSGKVNSNANTDEPQFEKFGFYRSGLNIRLEKYHEGELKNLKGVKMEITTTFVEKINNKNFVGRLLENLLVKLLSD